MSRARLALVVLLAGLLPIGCILPRWPVDAPLSSPYGIRFRGILPGIHRGVDLNVPEGTEVRAMARGRVRFAGSMRGYGQVVWLDHPGGTMTVYGHLSRIDVVPGEEVGGGQVIAWSGSTGDVSGAHLHFEVWRHGREVDPVPLLGKPPGG